MHDTNPPKSVPTQSTPETKGPAVARLTAHDGGVLFLRTGRYLLGRASKCDLVLTSRGVSRCHATLEVGEGKAMIVDLNSRNGVRVDDQPTDRSLLAHGSVVRLGGATYVFEWLDQVPIDDEPTPSFEDPSGELSPAQQRVFLLLLDGLAEKEIATQLKKSQHTVHNHVKRIYATLRVNSRPELLAQFVSSSFRSQPRPTN